MIFRTVNIEIGLPTVKEAITRLDVELKTSKSYGVKVLKIIHGYGSSGKGGKIRTELRRELEVRKSKNQIADYITGENFSIFNSSTQKILHLDKEISSDRDLDRHNNGVTFVVLK